MYEDEKQCVFAGSHILQHKLQALQKGCTAYSSLGFHVLHMREQVEFLQVTVVSGCIK